MCDGQADVLIQMKDLNFSPIDVWLLGERIEKFQLRCGSGSNDPRASIAGYGTSNGRGCLPGSGFAQNILIVKDFQHNVSPSTALAKNAGNCTRREICEL